MRPIVTTQSAVSQPAKPFNRKLIPQEIPKVTHFFDYCCQICNSAFMAKAMCKKENKLRIPKVWGGFFHRVHMS